MKTKTNQLVSPWLSVKKPVSSFQQESMKPLTTAARRPSRLSLAFAVAMLAAFFSLNLRIAGADPNLPAGFKSTLLTTDIPNPSSLTFGPDGKLYVCAIDGNVWVVNPVPGAARIFGDVDGVDDGPFVDWPIGILVDRRGTVFVSDSWFDPITGHLNGRVRALRDTDGDGVADVNEVVLDGLPNGRHNNNNLAFGPDGYIYLPNGSRTDDGIHGSFCIIGGEQVYSNDCPGEDVTYSGTILRIDPKRRNQTPADTRVVARGMRNMYDIVFWPKDPRYLFIGMNGSDVPEADDLLFRANVIDGNVDDMGWPSCLYNIGAMNGYPLIPVPNPVPGVANLFGPCDKKAPRHLNRPLLTFGKHVAVAGLAFAPRSFARGYAGDLFAAEFGQDEPALGPAGHQIVRIRIGDDGFSKTGKDGNPVLEHFAFGATTDAPVDLVFGSDGAMYVLDILNNSVFRIERNRPSSED
jgi:glucose/arabinose dehydrogenase